MATYEGINGLTEDEKTLLKGLEDSAVRIKKYLNISIVKINNIIESIKNNLETDGSETTITYNEVNSKCKIIMVKENVTTSLDCLGPSDVCYTGQVNRNFLMDSEHDINYVLNHYGSKTNLAKTVTNCGAGALEYNGYLWHIGDDFIPVDRSKEYRINFVAECRMNNGDFRDDVKTMHYGGVTCYDGDKRYIGVHQVYFRWGTRSTVVNDVNIGDTEILIEGEIDNWYTGSRSHMRSVMVHKLRDDGTYGYIGQNGKYYDEFGYTRDGGYNWYNKNKLIDNGDGTFIMKLRSGATAFIPAGSKINNSASGGSYNYWMAWWRLRADGYIKRYKSGWRLDRLDEHTRNYWGVVRNGAVYFKTMGLFSYRAYDYGAGKYISPNDVKVQIHKFSLESRPRH